MKNGDINADNLPYYISKKILKILEKYVKNYERIFDNDYEYQCNFFTNKNVKKILRELGKAKIMIQYEYIDDLIHTLRDEDFAENLNFTILADQVPNFSKYIEQNRMISNIYFLRFVQGLGCFDNSFMNDKMGRKTKTRMAQKASTTLREIIDKGIIYPEEFTEILTEMPSYITPNSNFLSFISEKNKGQFINLLELLRLRVEDPKVVTIFMKDFDEIKKYRKSLTDEGLPKINSWEETFDSYMNNIQYDGVTEEFEELAQVFKERGMSQLDFDYAVYLRRAQDDENICPNILDKPLSEKIWQEDQQKLLNQENENKDKNGKEEHIKEEHIREEDIKEKDFKRLLSDSKEKLQKAYEKQFTWEWLSKQDPRNLIIGSYCDCCANISSNYYGAEIVRATVTDPEVQNIVVKNAEDEIVAKGALYLNKLLRYGVINDFEIAKEYKKHEVQEGYYKVPEDSKDELKRNAIFSAFKRGIEAFAKEYEREHPGEGINIITVGMGYNRLKKQVESLEKSKYPLTVRGNLQFYDADEEQYIIYESPVIRGESYKIPIIIGPDEEILGSSEKEER